MFPCCACYASSWFLRYGLDELVLSSLNHPLATCLLRVMRLGTRPRQPRGLRLRLALESLGPIFVKFGQVLSTRRDLIPADIANELALLQDRVPPFPSAQAAACVEGARRAAGQAVRAIRCRSGGLGLDRPGALRGAARRPRGGGQGAAPGMLSIIERTCLC